jgi:hypothetical protein
MSNQYAEVKIEGLEEVLQGLDPKLAADVVRSTINNLAFQARKDVIKEMSSVFDNPTPYTLSSVLVQKAENQNLSAFISIKDQAIKGTPPSKFLGPEIYGGERSHISTERQLAKEGIIEPNEYLIPWKAPRNQYGNVSPGLYNKVLSGLQAATDAYQNSPAAGQGYKGTRKGRRKKYDFFAVRRKGTTIIFEKKLNSSGDGHVTPLFVSADKVSYKPRLKFYETVRAVMAHTQEEFNKQLEFYIGRWFSKRK